MTSSRSRLPDAFVTNFFYLIRFGKVNSSVLLFSKNNIFRIKPAVASWREKLFSLSQESLPGPLCVGGNSSPEASSLESHRKWSGDGVFQGCVQQSKFSAGFTSVYQMVFFIQARVGRNKIF